MPEPGPISRTETASASGPGAPPRCWEKRVQDCPIHCRSSLTYDSGDRRLPHHRGFAHLSRVGNESVPKRTSCVSACLADHGRRADGFGAFPDAGVGAGRTCPHLRITGREASGSARMGAAAYSGRRCSTTGNGRSVLAIRSANGPPGNRLAGAISEFPRRIPPVTGGGVPHANP